MNIITIANSTLNSRKIINYLSKSSNNKNLVLSIMDLRSKVLSNYAVVNNRTHLMMKLKNS